MKSRFPIKRTKKRQVRVRKIHEISLGCGEGRDILREAWSNPKRRYVAIEINPKHTNQVSSFGLPNLQVVTADAIKGLQTLARNKYKAKQITIRMPDVLLFRLEEIFRIARRVVFEKGVIIITSPRELSMHDLAVAQKYGFEYVGDMRLLRKLAPGGVRPGFESEYVAHGAHIATTVFVHGRERVYNYSTYLSQVKKH